METKFNFSSLDWQRIKNDWSAWWKEELDRPMVILKRLEPPEGIVFPKGKNIPVFSDFDDSPLQFPLDMDVEKVIDHFQNRLECTRYYGDAFPKFWPNFGPGIISGFLGAEVHFSREESTIWFDIGEKIPASEFKPAFNPENVYWKRVKEITEAAVQRWGENVLVAHTDLGENLDILSALVDDQDLLTGMLLNPGEISRISDSITDLWCQYYNALYEIIKKQGLGTSPWAGIYSTGRCYMLQSDMSVMIDSSMYEQFVLPDLKKCCNQLDHAFYHLDGKEQIQHLDLLLSIPNLHGIQWIPGAGNPPAEEWIDLLKRIRDAGKLCQLYVTPDGARKIKNELGGKGFAFYIWTETSHDEACKLIDDLYN
jgi:hypothetical protein